MSAGARKLAQPLPLPPNVAPGVLAVESAAQPLKPNDLLVRTSACAYLPPIHSAPGFDGAAAFMASRLHLGPLALLNIAPPLALLPPQLASGWVDRMFTPPANFNNLRSVHAPRPGTTGAMPGAPGTGGLGRPGTAAAAVGGGASPAGSPQKGGAAAAAAGGASGSPVRAPPTPQSAVPSPTRAPAGAHSPSGSPMRPGTAMTAASRPGTALTTATRGGGGASPSRPGTARLGIGSLWGNTVKPETGFEHRTPGQPPNHLTYQQRVWLMAPQETFSRKNGGILMDGSLMGALSTPTHPARGTCVTRNPHMRHRPSEHPSSLTDEIASTCARSAQTPQRTCKPQTTRWFWARLRPS